MKVVLQVLKENNLFAEQSKCEFGKRKNEYLGHIISEQGVATDLVKVPAMVNWPVPTNVTQLRGILGMTRYYRRFIQNYGLICMPLFLALKRNRFICRESQQQAFERLKEIMTKAPVLALPNYSKPFVLEADASGFGIGVVLMQEHGTIAYMSKAIGPKSTG